MHFPLKCWEEFPRATMEQRRLQQRGFGTGTRTGIPVFELLPGNGRLRLITWNDTAQCPQYEDPGEFLCILAWTNSLPVRARHHHVEPCITATYAPRTELILNPLSRHNMEFKTTMFLVRGPWSRQPPDGLPPTMQCLFH